MNQTLKTLLVALVCFLVGAGVFYAWSTMDALKKENAELTGQLPADSAATATDEDAAASTAATDASAADSQTTQSPAAQTGSITGSLGYPSQGIPPLAVYAFAAGNTKSYTAMLTAQNQMTFTMEDLEPGTYYLVAYTVGAPALSGGYTKAVACGLSVECTDHSLVPVVVTAGKTTTGVEIKDWYAPEDTFPAKP